MAAIFIVPRTTLHLSGLGWLVLVGVRLALWVWDELEGGTLRRVLGH